MKNIKIILCVIAVLLFNGRIVGKGNSVKYYPEKPKAGDEVTLIYNNNGTPLANADKIELTVYIFSIKSSTMSKIDSVYNINMIKEADGWKTKIKTKFSTDLIALKFENDEINDNNDNSGYFIRFYNEAGKETVNSKLFYASVLENLGKRLLETKKDSKLTYTIMSEVFRLSPQLKSEFLDSYFSAMGNTLSEEEFSHVALKELSTFSNLDLLNERQLGIIVSQYAKLKMKEKVNELSLYAIKKYPSGSCALSTKYNAFQKEKDFQKRLEIAESMRVQFKGITGEDAGYCKVLEGLFQEKNYNAINDLLKKNPSLIEYKNVCIILLTNFLKENVNIEMALSLAEKLVINTRKALNNSNPSENIPLGPKVMTLYRKVNLCGALFKYGDVLLRLNKREEALKQLEEAWMLIPIKYLETVNIELYIKCLLENEKYETAQKVIEEAIKAGKNSEDIRGYLKKVYVNKNKNDIGYIDYLTLLENSVSQKNSERFKQEMMKEKAPQFSLKDLDGKKVLLSDYKGKIVILDFWATWCGPCKASFPGIQKAVDKFSKDENVKFLFIDTWEKIEDKYKNASDFIKQNKYSFHVLVDEKDAAVKSFNVQGVPTKFVIDKEGFIRFKKAGAPEGIDAIVEEISAMINLVKEN